MDVKTITDIANPITNTLADAIAPLHVGLVIVAPAKEYTIYG